MTALRIAIVDDVEAMRDGRASWLVRPNAFGTHRDLSVASCDSIDFEQALAMAGRWREVDLLILDALDARAPDVRAESAASHGVDFHDWDRVTGRRVVQEAIAHNPELLVIVVSGIVKRNPTVSRQMRGAGAHFVFDHDEVSTPAAFLDVVARSCHMQRPSRPAAADRRFANTAHIVREAGPDRGLFFGDLARKTGTARRRADALTEEIRKSLGVTRDPSGRRVNRQSLIPRIKEFFGERDA